MHQAIPLQISHIVEGVSLEILNKSPVHRQTHCAHLSKLPQLSQLFYAAVQSNVLSSTCFYFEPQLATEFEMLKCLLLEENVFKTQGKDQKRLHSLSRVIILILGKAPQWETLKLSRRSRVTTHLREG